MVLDTVIEKVGTALIAGILLVLAALFFPQFLGAIIFLSAGIVLFFVASLLKGKTQALAGLAALTLLLFSGLVFINPEFNVLFRENTTGIETGENQISFWQQFVLSGQECSETRETATVRFEETRNINNAFELDSGIKIAQKSNMSGILNFEIVELGENKIVHSTTTNSNTKEQNDSRQVIFQTDGKAFFCPGKEYLLRAQSPSGVCVAPNGELLIKASVRETQRAKEECGLVEVVEPPVLPDVPVEDDGMFTNLTVLALVGSVGIVVLVFILRK